MPGAGPSDKEHMQEQTQTLLWGPAALEAKRQALSQLQARQAPRRERWIQANRYFYNRVTDLLRFLIEPGKRVLDVRCGLGQFLDAVKPAYGVGVDLTEEMVALARAKHPQYRFLAQDPEGLDLKETFDYILFQGPSDTVNVLKVLQRLRHACTPDTRLVIYDYNHLWQPILTLAERWGLKMPLVEQNWLSEDNLQSLLRLGRFEPLHTYREVLLPKYFPGAAELLNQIVAPLPLVNKLCMIKVMVARPAGEPRDPKTVSVSVIVPCKNEAGNIVPAVERIPEMGKGTEIIFCDDKSTDGTADEVRRMQAQYPHKNIRLVNGPGICKAQNVWTGFDAAQGDVLMILDADLTVMPEELPYFFDAIVEGTGEFINGTRLVYPVAKGAMKNANMAGNKAFSVVFSYLLGQRLTDTLCGTKVIWRSAWERVKPLRGTWGTHDRWGDYDLLFSASKLHLRIAELPVHYQERIYGTTKMVKVFKNGLHMLRMCLGAFVKLKARL